MSAGAPGRRRRANASGSLLAHPDDPAPAPGLPVPMGDGRQVAGRSATAPGAPRRWGRRGCAATPGASDSSGSTHTSCLTRPGSRPPARAHGRSPAGRLGARRSRGPGPSQRSAGRAPLPVSQQAALRPRPGVRTGHPQVEGRTGTAPSTASTNASRRSRRAGVSARWTPTRSSEAVLLARATGASDARGATLARAPSGRPRRSRATKTLVSIRWATPAAPAPGVPPPGPPRGRPRTLPRAARARRGGRRAPGAWATPAAPGSGGARTATGSPLRSTTNRSPGGGRDRGRPRGA